MLHSIIRDHDQNLAKKNEKIRALEKSTSIVAAKYAKDLSLRINEPIRACYQNEKRCDSEVKKLVIESENLSKLAYDWQTKLAEFDSALRDLGDVSAYAYAIERETNTILNATKRILAKKNAESLTP